jgi:hypothetical protein
MMQVTQYFLGFAVLGGVQAAWEPATTQALEQHVRRLVEDLGDPSHRRRETAHKKLIDAGEKILPILDKLAPPQDLEVRVRLARIRERLTRRDVVLAMDPKVEFVEDSKQQMPVLRGRFHLVQNGRVVEPRGNGPLILEQYEKLPDGRLLKRETWAFDADTLKKLAKRDAQGTHFVLALPWSWYQPMESVVIRVQFDSCDSQHYVPLTHSPELRAWYMHQSLRFLGAIPF